MADRIDTTAGSQGARTAMHVERLCFVRGQLGDVIGLVSDGYTPSPSMAQHLLSVPQSRL